VVLNRSWTFGGGEPMMLEVFFLQLSSAVCWAMILQEVMGIKIDVILAGEMLYRGALHGVRT
jgi:hypothetical protein